MIIYHTYAIHLAACLVPVQPSCDAPCGAGMAELHRGHSLRAVPVLAQENGNHHPSHGEGTGTAPKGGHARLGVLQQGHGEGRGAGRGQGHVP